MDLYVMDRDFNDLDIVENAESKIWKKCYCDPGEFEIYTIASTENVNLLQIGYYVVRKDDDMVGVIEKINISKDDDGRYMLLASGRCAKSLFARRIIKPQTTFTGTVGKRFAQMIYYNATNPEFDYRKLPNMNWVTAETDAGARTDKTQHTGTNLLEALIDLVASYGLGWKVTFDGENFTPTVFAGVDRTIDQTSAGQVIFADELDNLISSEYEKDVSQYGNVAMIAGEGEGSDRVWEGIDITGGQTAIAGLDRYEVFVDARDLQKTSTDSSGNETTMTDTQYSEQLQARGYEKLQSTKHIESFEGEVDWGAYKYRVDYDVGDLVTIKNKWGITANIRIISVEEVEDGDGYTVTPTFADCASVSQSSYTSSSGGASTAVINNRLDSMSSGGSVDLSSVWTAINEAKSAASVNASDINILERNVSSVQTSVSNNTADITALESRVSDLESGSGGGTVDSSTLLSMIYPVGSIYMSVNNVSPQTFLGGTWVKLYNRFLIGAGSSYSANTTGGETVHTLTTSEMPTHAHEQYIYNGGGSSTWTPDVGGYLVTAGSISANKNTTWARLGMGYAGAGSAHNNMPPYLAVYMWKRTA